MAKKKRGLKAHSPEQQKQYEREARLQYGPSEVNDSIQRWNSFSKAQQDARSSPRAIRSTSIWLRRWRPARRRAIAKSARSSTAGNSICATSMSRSLDRLRGLGQLYNSSPEFMANFQNIHADLPAYLEQVIKAYVDELENRRAGADAGGRR